MHPPSDAPGPASGVRAAGASAPAVATPRRDRRARRPSTRTAFVGATASLVAVFAASAAPIPLFDGYRRLDGLTNADLATAAVTYFAGVLTALLVFGRLSDHLGRRPVALAALVLAAAGCLVLTGVDGTPPLLAGRVLQGLACGLASSALASYVVDSAPPSPGWLAATVTACGPMVGLTIGALGSGALAQYGPAPQSLGYLICAGVLTVCAVAVAAGPDTVARTRGALASLRLQVGLPRTARRLFPVAACVFAATWALGGFYQAFGASVAADQLGTGNALVAAAVLASYMAPSVVGGTLAGRITPATAQRAGMAGFLLSVVALLVCLRAGAVLPFLAASVLAGASQGAAFAGSMRALLAGTGPAQRASVLSTTYIASYSGAAIPSFVAGQLSHTLDLGEISLGYGALAAVSCLVTLVAARNPRVGPASVAPGERPGTAAPRR
ncbi:MFS transporter [Marinactinospora rubrisoli]|uniref:MFS transporter n=1 Tax=Marinactinospora rubrisoli TaxID=2715399 RepID=A0ABW2KFL8_9ACTN